MPISHSNVLTCKGKIHVTIQLQNSSNNSRGRLSFFLHKKGAIISWKAIIGGMQLFQILLTGSCATNILFIFPLNQKLITSNKLNMGFLSVPNLVP